MAGSMATNDGLHEEADLEGIKRFGISMTTFPVFLQNEKELVKSTFG